jgi:ABC-type polysaccharide/polyol phosphate transport system ATPase subunit
MSVHSIEVDCVSKRYALGRTHGRYLTLREAVAGAFRRTPAIGSAASTGSTGLTGLAGLKGGPAPHWALRDVSFSVNPGEIVGLIGRNGAGKTTLLKMLARIIEPTSGCTRTRGRVGTLLEVGTGFHPELSGRENIYLNGAVLGMSRAEIARRFDAIVAFADVERFLDSPLKHYSSGMQLRLAFAVAAHLDTSIVVIDEVLAVGDAEFQRRCLGRMSEFSREGRTVVFVSHDLGAIAHVCDRVIWLDRGSVRADGERTAVIEEYMRDCLEVTPAAEYPADEGQPVQVRSVSVTDLAGRALDAPRRDVPFAINLSLVVSRPVTGLDMSVYLRNRQGVPVIDEAWSDTQPGVRFADAAGTYDVRVTIPPILAPGDYVVYSWVGSEYETFLDREVLRFHLSPRSDDRRQAIERYRIIQPSLDWTVRVQEEDALPVAP